jgi:acid phosphatase (class A)
VHGIIANFIRLLFLQFSGIHAWYQLQKEDGMRWSELPETKQETKPCRRSKPSWFKFLLRDKVIKLLLVCLLSTAGCSTFSLKLPPDASSGKHMEKIEGYLTPDDLPNSTTLLAAPPAIDSAAFAADEETYRMTRALNGSPRWNLAVKDANLTFPEAVEAFSCALDAPITEKETPNVYNLLRRTRVDATRATRKAKDHYQRIRPFVANNDATCTPDYEHRLMNNGSYPSAHATIGWAWALILAEVSPDHVDDILARGQSFGQSRVICGVHWQSDVMAGQIVGAGVVARLHADPMFRALVEAARADISLVRKKGLKPGHDCKAEAASLKFGTTNIP